jgi:hypothetical protein
MSLPKRTETVISELAAMNHMEAQSSLNYPGRRLLRVNQEANAECVLINRTLSGGSAHRRLAAGLQAYALSSLLVLTRRLQNLARG